jgi:SWI/SNF-related matrix-associated actin-dependent regulator 1 of chromatin subfamily A
MDRVCHSGSHLMGRKGTGFLYLGRRIILEARRLCGIIIFAGALRSWKSRRLGNGKQRSKIMRIEHSNQIGFYAVASYDERLLPKGAGFRWDPALKIWWTDSEECAERLSRYFGETAKAYFAKRELESEKIALGFGEIDSRLYSYQREGVEHLIKSKRALLADEMGLGKTAQILQSVEVQKLSKVVIVCPATLRFVWRNEAVEWAKSRSLVVCKNADDLRDLRGADADILVISYDLLRALTKKHAAFFNQRFSLCVFDESHKIKNSKTAQSKAAGLLVKQAERVVLATGTPILNRPKELYFPLRLILGSGFNAVFGDWETFHRRYCDGRKGRFGWEVDGASNLDELNRKLASGANMLRRRKDQVLDLPDFLRTIIPLDLKVSKGEEALVQRAVQFGGYEETLKELRGASGAFEELADIRREAGEKKIESAISIAEDLLESGPLVIFAHHKSVIEGIEARLKCRVVKVTGDVTGQAREAAVSDFQSGDADVCICSIMAAGAGLTLTRATQMLFVEFPWDPGNLEQAEARCHRIGSVGTVNAYYLVADGGLDSHILQLIRGKADIQKRAIDGKKQTKGKEEK